MPRYAAFLRGVNLGARRKAGSAELRSCFEGIGLEDVRPSGPAATSYSRRAARRVRKLTGRIEKALPRRSASTSTCSCAPRAELEAIAAHEPFPAKLVDGLGGQAAGGAAPEEAVGRSPQAGCSALAHDEDRLAFAGRELYWLPSGGMRDAASTSTSRSRRAVDDAHQGHARGAHSKYFA